MAREMARERMSKLRPLHHPFGEAYLRGKRVNITDHRVRNGKREYRCEIGGKVRWIRAKLFTHMPNEKQPRQSKAASRRKNRVQHRPLIPYGGPKPKKAEVKTETTSASTGASSLRLHPALLLVPAAVFGVLYLLLMWVL